VALLLPAVQSARATAHKLTCSSRLRQIGIALTSYKATVGTFPPASVALDGLPAERSNEEEWGWHAFLLPHLEEQKLADRLDINGRRLMEVLADPRDRQFTQAAISVYLCPSDDPETTLDRAKRHFYGKGNTGRIAVGKSNYVAVLGLYDKPWLGRAAFPNNGVFFTNAGMNNAGIRDGLSSTLAVGERDMRCYAASWPGVRNPPGPCNWGVYHNRGRVSMKLNSPEDPEFQKLTYGAWDACNSCTEAFSSRHVGGANFLFCDGSVRFISEHIDFNNGGLTHQQIVKAEAYDPAQLGVYQRLGIRNDGQRTAAGDY
jgi:prepilin-type processing-associated H-X9-DG protein